MAYQKWNVFAALSQGWNRKREYGQAIIQVTPELPVFHHLFQVPMSSCNHPNIHLLCTGAA